MIFTAFQLPDRMRVPVIWCDTEESGVSGSEPQRDVGCSEPGSFLPGRPAQPSLPSASKQPHLFSAEGNVRGTDETERLGLNRKSRLLY